MKDTGIVIAAGLGSRLGPFTQAQPKCLLPLGGRPLLDWTLDHLRTWDCEPLVAVVGHLAETIERPGLIRVLNAAFRDNNILHSLMCAAAFLRGPIIASYSDIWVEPPAYGALMATPGDIVAVVDLDWRPYYEGRELHPPAEAEKAHIDCHGRVVRIGKHLPDEAPAGQLCGEFIGLWRMSATGTETWLRHFHRLDATLEPLAPFQHAAQWRKAYITDMLQELLDHGVEVRAARIERGWAELDTDEDYRRLLGIAERQRLDTLVAACRAEQAARGRPA